MQAESQPWPTTFVAPESSTSRAGPRKLFPFARAITSSAASCQFPAKASRGTATSVRVYPQNGDGPVGARAVGQPAGKQPQAGGQHLAEAGDEAHQCGGCAETLQERPDDTARAFIGHVGEKADQAEADDEANSRRAWPWGRPSFLVACQLPVLLLFPLVELLHHVKGFLLVAAHGNQPLRLKKSCMSARARRGLRKSISTHGDVPRRDGIRLNIAT